VWSDFESESVAGRFQLGKVVRSEGRYGWFETSFNGKPATISMIESLNDEDALLDRLKAAGKVRHPNVMTILETGAAKVKDTPLVYAVMEPAEENLEDVLRVRALSVEETRQVAEGLVKALTAIHKEKLVCGEMEASSVLATGDVIKLRSDKLQKLAASAQDLEQPNPEFQMLVSKDVQALGALLYRCLTQKRPQMESEDLSFELLPQPFSQMVRRAMGGQATVEEMDALLRQPVSALRAAENAMRETPSSFLAEEADERRRGASGNLPWAIAGVVLLLLIAGFTLRAVLHSSKGAPPPVPLSHANPQTSPKSVPVARTRAAVKASPVAKKPAAETLPKPAVVQTPSVSQSTGKNTIWRVVAYTYNHQDQAEHKAQTIHDKYPGLKAEVFSPKGDGAPYLVTLGGPMERDAAFQLRNRAVGQGLPRDTYVQNYSH
jgi:hypothetical protein